MAIGCSITGMKVIGCVSLFLAIYSIVLSIYYGEREAGTMKIINAMVGNGVLGVIC